MMVLPVVLLFFFLQRYYPIAQNQNVGAGLAPAHVPIPSKGIALTGLKG